VSIERIAALHAGLILAAREQEAAALRYGDHGDAERADQARDYASEHRADARAIADLLARFDDVHVPQPGQLALFSDGAA
jgi:hypothetical protein